MELDSAPTLPADSKPSAVDPSPAPLEDRPFAERYRVRALLGAGGMGEVHLGKDERIGREVAIKLARGKTDGASADAVARFVREARVQGQLEHPSVVPVYDLGHNGDGSVFFTMKRVRGMTLEQILTGLARGDRELERKYSRRKLLGAFQSVCLAVHFAHTRGVLHRDLKPGNIMLGDFGEVYVLDWGVAKIGDGADETPGGAPTIDAAVVSGATTHGAVMGSPGYMPPEQVKGQVDRVDPRVDVYALGVVLFELLTLKPLHPRGTLAAMIAATLEGADARASVRAPERDVPPELEAICVKATATSPDDRYADARALHDAVERYLDGDRDLEKRRQLADEHARKAGEAAARALDDGTDDDRKEALQHAGRALALDPKHQGATRTMLRVLLAPPATMPSEVRARLEEEGNRNRRVAARAAGLNYVLWLLFAPTMFFMGIKNVAPVAVFTGACLVIACMSFLGTRKSTDSRRMYPFALGAGLLVVLTAAPLFGPYTVMPGLVAATVIGFLLSSPPGTRWATLIAGAATLALPMILEETGLLPATTTFSDGALRITSWAVSFPPALTTIVLAVIALGLVLSSGWFIIRVREALDDAEKARALQAWHLRHLIPDEAHDAITAEPEPPEPRTCSLL